MSVRSLWSDAFEAWHADTTPLSRSLPLGFLAMAPLWIAYEFAQARTAGAMRNAAEVILTYPLVPTGELLPLLRRILLVVLSVWALVHCARRQWELGPLLGRVVLEGLAGALALGPLLVFLMGRFGDALPALPKLGDQAVGDTSFALFAFGSAAWEEIVFRVGAFGLVYLVARELCTFAGLPEAGARWGGEVLAWLGSSFLFAAYHLSASLGFLGVGGEPFRPALFTYRLLAGMLLVLLLRWRGPGVAAWSHGVFNLALCVGAGPAVFQ
ncbi:MAG: CPBP family intramembrane metalloprotease [Planctomycetes bacterium]|nr:CPBP family intramembrane metalloprotease [Planctomycetota bacterium]